MARRKSINIYIPKYFMVRNCINIFDVDGLEVRLC